MIMDVARKVLAVPAVFDAYQSLVGEPRCHERLIREWVHPCAGERVLDIGCGVGASLRYLPDSVNYVGIDISEAYIAKAQAQYGKRATFICADVAAFDATTLGKFDRAFSFGVLHHLSDEIAARLIALVRYVVKPGGTFVTADPCYSPGQHPVAKLLIDNDRGKHIRDVEGFERIVSSLGSVKATVHHDLLRVPFTKVVIEVEVH
jgi:SAM-dependent methyltransferase